MCRDAPMSKSKVALRARGAAVARIRRRAILIVAGSGFAVLVAWGATRTPSAAGPNPPVDPWSLLEPGLTLGTFVSPRPAAVGDSTIRVLRVDPGVFKLRLMNASAPDQGRRLTAKEWCRRNGLVAAINASMYQTDLRTSVSLMRTRTHVNNPRLSKDRAALAFDRLDRALPPVQIIDRECQDFEELRRGYGTLVQSIRMVSCTGKNVWRQQPNAWSTAAIGTDRDGNALFIHARSPYSTHDLIEILLALPIALKNAMYVEGGPEAQMYVTSDGREFEFVGLPAVGFGDARDDPPARPVPNVVGVARIERSRGAP
jgi:phosphodiester glycosidase